MAGVFDILAQAQGNPNLLLTGVLIPFLLIFVVFWGMLNLIKIFGDGPVARKVNIIISLCVAILAGITPAWQVIVGMAAFLGDFAWVSFFVVFIIASIFWLAGRSRSSYNENWKSISGSKVNSMIELDNQIAKVLKKLQEAEWRGDSAKVAALSDTLKKLNEKKEHLHQIH
jgi:hypothetical protein